MIAVICHFQKKITLIICFHHHNNFLWWFEITLGAIFFEQNNDDGNDTDGTGTKHEESEIKSISDGNNGDNKTKNKPKKQLWISLRDYSKTCVKI